MPPKDTSWPDIKYPSMRDDGFMTVDKWIEGKRIDDGAEGLWRVHDKLYDLEDFVNKHPGGAMWLQITKGTDVTEAFESHHLSTVPENMLKKFYVREARTPRSSPYTFHPKGFYKTLKSRVNSHFKNKNPRPTLMSALTLDCVAILALITAIWAARSNSYLMATISGVLMTGIVNCGHNFVHMKDSWRIYYYHLTSFSVREWRISHCLSHHLHTNTIRDLEISLFEPLFEWLPYPNKSLIQRYLSWVYFPLALSTINPSQLIKRIIFRKFTTPDLLLFVPLVLMYSLGSLTFPSTALMWLYIITVCGFLFGAIGFTAAHHHPTSFHDGDLPRKDRDWGLNQFDAVQDRLEIRGNNFLTLFIFGEHTLHHLFPTIDHAYLHEIMPIFEETLEEFGIESNVNTIPDLIIGAFKQLARVEKNTEPRKQKKVA